MVRVTKIHINALLTTFALFFIAVYLILRGEYCGGIGVAVAIAGIATTFAETHNGNGSGREE